MKGLQFADEPMGTSGKCLSVVLSVAGDKDKGYGGQILRIDVPKIEGKFSGCGDLFTAMCGGEQLQSVTLYTLHHALHCIARMETAMS